MRLVYHTYFLIFTVIFLTTCSNFNRDRTDESFSESQEKRKALNSAYLDSATSRLFAYHKMRYDTSYRNPYGFQKRDVVLYPDSVYKRRIASITSDFPLVFNERVKMYIDAYAFRKKNLTERMLGKSSLYYPYIEKILREKNLPHELKLLTMIESALQPNAESPKSAVGLWQIRYSTGKWLGLTIDSYIDERKDPYASSEAGIIYLKKLYDLYGDWWLAIAAYNCGPSNLNKVLAGKKGAKNYWDIEPYLPRETRNYVPAFIAMVYLYYFQEEHNLRPKFPDVSFKGVDTVRIYGKITFDEIVEHTGVDKKELVFLNPGLIRQVIPARKKGYRLVLPVNTIAAFEKMRANLLEEKHIDHEVSATAQIIRGREPVVPQDDRLVQITYKIKPGNTLDEISRYYGCSVEDLMNWNALYDPLLQVGAELKVYIPEKEAYEAEASAASSDFLSSSSNSK